MHETAPSTGRSSTHDAYATRWRQAVSQPSGLIARSRAMLRSSAISLSAALDRRNESAFLRGVYCHYVFDDQREDFERLVVALKALGTFVDTETCVQMIQGTRPIDGRYLHFSFDDGFRNNFTNAVPILKKHGVPAMFFIPSALVEGDWETTRRFCLETTRYAGVIEMLRWDEVREMVAQGFEIGSHTRTHARFSDISGDRARMEDEILGSKRELEDKLGRECRYISWPYGRVADADDASLAVARRAGYVACFGAYRGTMRPGHTDLFSIPRHHIEPQWPLSHALHFARGNRE